MSSLADLPRDTARDRPLERPDPLPLISPLPIEVFDPADEPTRHAGRATVRATVLAMLTADGSEPLLPGPQRTPGGVFWGVRSDNGLTVAMRAISFPIALAARRDAVNLLARAAEFELVPVQSAETGAMSFWVLLSGRVVLVGGQAWRQSAKSTVRQFQRALARLPRS